MKGNQKIAVLRLSAIGDVVLCSSMIMNLSRDSNCEVYWITTKDTVELLGEIPGVKFILVPKPKSIQKFLLCRKILTKYSFDCLFLAQASFSAHFVSLNIRAKRKVGFDSLRSKDFHRFFINERIKAKEEHFVDGYYGFFSHIGIPVPKQIDWRGLFENLKKDRERFHLPKDSKILAVNPCSSKFERNWSLLNHAEIIGFAQQLGFYVLIIGGKSKKENAFNLSICDACKNKPLNLTGKIKLSELPSLICCADVVLAPDTGSVHIATALRIPVIGIYAVANPHLTGPYQSTKFIINKFPEAVKKFGSRGKSYFYSRVHHPEAMNLISVHLVKEKLEEAVSFMPDNSQKYD